MTLFSTFFGYVFGMPLGILLKVSDKEGLRPNAVLYKILDVIANIFRSIPFLILLILLIPFTRFLVGKSYGTTATIVPLTIAAIPFIGRMVESSLNEVDPGVIEAARSMGASNLQIVFQGNAGRSKNIPDLRSYHCNRNYPWLLRNGRNRRRRRTWRHCSTLRIQPLADGHHAGDRYPSGSTGTDFPDNWYVHSQQAG